MLVAALARPATAQSGRPIVLLVHGRHQAFMLTDDLAHEYTEGLLEGLQAVPHGDLITKNDLRFVAYQNLFEPGKESLWCPPTEGANHLAPPVWVERTTKYLTDLLASQTQPVNAALRLITKDTQKYLENGRLACAVNGRLTSAIDEEQSAGRPVIIVAHSMGGLVVLRSLYAKAVIDQPPPRSVSATITIGSQLRVPSLVAALEGLSPSATFPREVPATLGEWRDFQGELDWVSPTPRGAPANVWRFAPKSSYYKFATITTNPEDPHDVRGYLLHPAVGQAVLHEWCKAYKPPKPAACGQAP